MTQDPLRKAYQARMYIAQKGSVHIDNFYGRLIVRQPQMLPKGERIGTYDSRAKVRDIAADCRNALQAYQAGTSRQDRLVLGEVGR